MLYMGVVHGIFLQKSISGVRPTYIPGAVMMSIHKWALTRYIKPTCYLIFPTAKVLGVEVRAVNSTAVAVSWIAVDIAHARGLHYKLHYHISSS